MVHIILYKDISDALGEWRAEVPFPTFKCLVLHKVVMVRKSKVEAGNESLRKEVFFRKCGECDARYRPAAYCCLETG